MEALNNEGEEQIMCPYNHAHYIRKSKMNGHLVKCSKNYPNPEMVRCDFNTTHIIPKPELQYHHENCSDRRKTEACLIEDQGVDYNKYPVHNVDLPCDESWDDYEVKSYDPKEYCQNNPVLRHMDVEPAARRRNFRVEERERLRKLRGLDVANQPGNASMDQATNGQGNRPADNRVINEEVPDDIKYLTERIQKGAKTSYFLKPKN